MVDSARYKKYLPEDFALDPDFIRWVLSPDEELQQFWTTFLNENPRKREDIQQAITLVRHAGLSTDAADNEAFLQGWQRVEAQAEATAPRRKWMPYAAAVAILAAALVYYFVATPARTELRYQTANNETREVKLPDGSVVTLNANSSLHVLFAGADDERLVRLEGEAFLRVVHLNNEKHFRVELPGETSVEVLGTEFNVYARQQRVSVYLQSGRVRLHASGGDSMLKPGEEGVMEAGQPIFAVQSVGESLANATLAWKSGVYIMEDIPLHQVAEHIHDQFGVSVTLHGTGIGERRITAKVPAQHMELLLKVLSESLSVRIEKKGDSIEISDM